MGVGELIPLRLFSHVSGHNRGVIIVSLKDSYAFCRILVCVLVFGILFYK